MHYIATDAELLSAQPKDGPASVNKDIVIFEVYPRLAIGNIRGYVGIIVVVFSLSVSRRNR